MTEQPNGNPLTSDQLIELLRSDVAKDRARALDAIYPGETVTMIRVTMAGTISMASTKTPHLPSLFTGLCWASQQIGRACGMSLCWVADPKAAEGKIVLPGGRLPPMG